MEFSCCRPESFTDPGAAASSSRPRVRLTQRRAGARLRKNLNEEAPRRTDIRRFLSTPTPTLPQDTGEGVKKALGRLPKLRRRKLRTRRGLLGSSYTRGLS